MAYTRKIYSEVEAARIEETAGGFANFILQNITSSVQILTKRRPNFSSKPREYKKQDKKKSGRKKRSETRE